MRRLALAAIAVLLAVPAYGQQVPNPMSKDGANALMPEVYDNLGIARSVKSYGAKCDGTTDDTAALQAAIDANESSPTNERPTLSFPHGDCLTGTLTISAPVNLRGMGQKGGTKLILKAGSATPLLIVATAGTYPAAYSARIIIDDMQLLSAGGNLDPAGVGTAHGLDLRPGSYRVTTELHRVMIHNFAGYGVERTSTHDGPLYAYDSQFVANLIGVHNNSGPDWTLIQCQVYSNLTKGISIPGASNNYFLNVAVYSNGTDGLYVYGPANDNQWFGGSIDRNGEEGVQFDAFTGREFKFFGLNFAQNNAAAGGFSDVKFDATSTGRVSFVSPIFATMFSDPSSYNIKWINNSTSIVHISGGLTVGGGLGYANFANRRDLLQLDDNSVRAYGAKCDNVTDDSAAFQAAIDANAFGAIQLPVGTCMVSGLLLNKPIRISGRGNRESILKSPNGSTQPVITVQNTTNSDSVGAGGSQQLDNFKITSQSRTDAPGLNAVHGIRFLPSATASSNTWLSYITIENVPGSCLYGDNTGGFAGVTVNADHFQCSLPMQYGVYVNSLSDWYFNGGGLYGAGLNNFHCTGCSAIHIYQLQNFSAIGDGLHIFGSDNFFWHGGSIDRNGGHGVYISQADATNPVYLSDVTIGWNSREAATSSDLYIASTNTAPVYLANVVFYNRTTSPSANDPIDNIHLTGGNTGYVYGRGVDFNAGNWLTAGVLGGVTRFYRGTEQERTWTPTIVGSTGGTAAMTTQNGWYTVSGGGVQLYGSVVASSIAGLTGTLKIGGLPVPPVAAGFNPGACSFASYQGWVAPANHTWLSGQLAGASNPTTILVNRNPTNASISSESPVGEWTAPVSFNFTCNYRY